MSAKDDNLKLYAEYNKTLRTWMVGFGFGVPALFIVNEAAQKRLLGSNDAACIVWLFLAGSGLQIISALLNKVVAWCAYHQHDVGASSCGPMVKVFASLENAFVVDIAFDLLSLAAFSLSIVLIASLFLGA